MNRTLTLALSSFLLLGSATAQQQAASAYDFSDSVGVNTHFSYINTLYYQQPAKLISAIQTLNVRHVRDGLAYSWIAPNLYALYGELAQAKISPELVMPNPANGGPSSASIEALLPNYPGVEAIEGPNEYDLSGDANWASDLRAYLPNLWHVGQDTGLPVIGPSLTQTASYPDLGNVADDMGLNNLHAYWGGRNPETTGWGGLDAQGNAYGSFAYDFDDLNIDGPGLPDMMTESGYVASNTAAQNVIPESVEAIYEPRLLLHAWNEGIKRTYVYELMDDPSSTSGLGLLRSDLSARPAYTALAGLMGLLSDQPEAFVAGKLTYTLTGSIKGVETTLLEKQDGSFWLAIWLNGSIYDVNGLQSTPLAAQAVNLSIFGGKLLRDAWCFDGTGNTTHYTFSNATKSISVTSAVKLLRIS
jgi:hypothetical protein